MKTTPAELLHAYRQGERDFVAADLSGANLRGVNLSGASLGGANFHRANLAGASLRNAYLRKANLCRACLGNSSLAGADLRAADLQGANLRSADLSGADLSNANLGDADLWGSTLTHANLTGAGLRRAILTSAKMAGSDLAEAVLYGANVCGADLSGSRLVKVDLIGANLRSANLITANLSGANLSSANLTNANLTNANLSEANLIHARTDGAILNGTVLSHVALASFCRHPVTYRGPCFVDYRSVVLSVNEPKLKEFLRRTGMPDVFVEYMVDCARSLSPKKVFSLFQSTFISYGGPDEAFARRLNEALEEQGVTTFFFQDDASPGEKLHRMMRRGVNEHDRVILVCSRESLDRPGVLNEIEETLAREARDGGNTYLIPIRLDDYVFHGWNPAQADVAQAVRDRVVADFRRHGDPEAFKKGVSRLLAVLRTPMVHV